MVALAADFSDRSGELSGARLDRQRLVLERGQEDRDHHFVERDDEGEEQRRDGYGHDEARGRAQRRKARADAVLLCLGQLAGLEPVLVKRLQRGVAELGLHPLRHHAGEHLGAPRQAVAVAQREARRAGLAGAVLLNAPVGRSIGRGLPATIVFVNAGTQISRIESTAGLLSPTLIASFVALAFFPWAAKGIVAVVKRSRG